MSTCPFSRLKLFIRFFSEALPSLPPPPQGRSSGAPPTAPCSPQSLPPGQGLRWQGFSPAGSLGCQGTKPQGAWPPKRGLGHSARPPPVRLRRVSTECAQQNGGANMTLDLWRHLPLWSVSIKVRTQAAKQLPPARGGGAARGGQGFQDAVAIGVVEPHW